MGGLSDVVDSASRDYASSMTTSPVRFAAIAGLATWVMLGGADSRETAQRPRDPWVFRCVLDQHPRMVVINPTSDLWLAFDATNCSLAKVWKGDVKFDGAVYTTVHGPQPTSRGAELVDAAPGERAWKLLKGDTTIPSEVVWRGYAFEDGEVWLKMTINGDDGSAVEVQLSPEFDGDSSLLLHCRMSGDVAGRTVLLAAVSSGDPPSASTAGEINSDLDSPKSPSQLIDGLTYVALHDGRGVRIPLHEVKH